MINGFESFGKQDENNFYELIVKSWTNEADRPNRRQLYCFESTQV